MCIAAGLVGGEAFSIDASLIKADVDKKKRVPGDPPIDWPKVAEASRAVREYLASVPMVGMAMRARDIERARHVAWTAAGVAGYAWCDRARRDDCTDLWSGVFTSDRGAAPRKAQARRLLRFSAGPSGAG
jgi:hypothetical protein